MLKQGRRLTQRGDAETTGAATRRVGDLLLGDQRDARGDQDHAEGVAQRTRSALLTASWLPIRTPGDRADEDVAGEAEVDVAADPVGDARRPQQDGGVEDVGADDALGRQAEDGDQDDRDQRAAAGRGEADHEAGGRRR